MRGRKEYLMTKSGFTEMQSKTYKHTLTLPCRGHFYLYVKADGGSNIDVIPFGVDLGHDDPHPVC